MPDPGGEHLTNERMVGSAEPVDGRWSVVTSDAYSEMLQLGLHALESDDDLDPTVVQRLRARFTALVTGSTDDARERSRLTG